MQPCEKHVEFFLPSPDARLHSDPHVGTGGGNGGMAGGESRVKYIAAMWNEILLMEYEKA